MYIIYHTRYNNLTVLLLGFLTSDHSNSRALFSLSLVAFLIVFLSGEPESG